MTRPRLGHPSSPKRTAALTGAAAILLATTGGTLWTAVKLLTDPLHGGPIDFWGEVVPAMALSALVLCFTYFFGFLAYLSLTALREKRWLDGTMLGHRRLIRTVWVDLAAARVTLVRPRNWPREADRLVAASQTGTEVTVPLRGSGGMLPREQLTALADAVMAGAGADDHAKATADKLHRLASEPEALLSGELLEAAKAPPKPPTSGRYPVVLRSGLAVLLLMTSVSGVLWAWEEAHRRTEFQRAGECRSSPASTGCRTDRAATVVEVTFCDSRYCGDTRTSLVLRLSGGGRAEAAFRSRVSGLVAGDQIAARLFHGEVVAVHDGSTWVDTNRNPRVALPYTFALASAFLGAGVGVLLGAVDAGIVHHVRRRSPLRSPRQRWSRIGWIVFLTPLPAVFAAFFFGSPPIWVLLLVDAATATAAVAYVRRRGWLRRPVEAVPAAPDA